MPRIPRRRRWPQGRRDAGGRLWVANLNAPGQVVVAGAMEDVDWLVENARDVGIRRAVKLNVAGAFHSPLMEPAVAAVEEALATTDLSRSRSSTSGRMYRVTKLDVADAASLLARQVVSPVRFSASLASMAAAGADTFVHVGPGDVTAGMARRAAKECQVLIVNSIDSMDAAADVLAGR